MTAILSREEGRKLLSKPAKRSKFGNKKVTVDGQTFDSQKEANRWQELKLLEQAGEISHLERQPKFKLWSGNTQICYDNGRQATYSADFAYFSAAENKRVIEDVKSKATRTQVYLLKRAIVHANYPMTKIIEV